MKHLRHVRGCFCLWAAVIQGGGLVVVKRNDQNGLDGDLGVFACKKGAACVCGQCGGDNVMWHILRIINRAKLDLVRVDLGLQCGGGVIRV